MSIYRIDGDSRNYAYGIDGSDLAQAFDIDKNQLLDTTPPVPPVKQSLNVMSYNVQYFTGRNSDVQMQQSILETYTPSIIGMQEFSTTGATPSVGQTVLSDFPIILNSNPVVSMSGLGLASKLPLYGSKTQKYATQDPDDMTRYGVERAYIKTYFDFNNKKICFINTHLSVLNLAPIYGQMAELFALAEQEDYVIITGDFNTWFSAFTNTIYVNTYKQFVDAGYKLANNSPTVGITNTYSNLTDVTTLSGMRSNPDSIIVSGNIDIDSVVFDTIKLSNLDGNTIDHIAVVATLLI